MVPTKISNHHHSGLTVHVGDKDVANLIFAKVGGRAGLARHCSLLQSVLPEITSKRFRDLRACLRPLLSEFVRESKCSASTQMTHALQDKRYKDAMCLVRGMRRARTPPKLGCVQRWVREVMDAAGASLDNPTTLQLLDAVMRLQPVTWSWMVSSTTAVATEHKVVERREVETARSSSNLLRCGIFRPPTSSSTTIEPPACNDETPRAERLDLETKQRTRRRCEYNVVLRQKGRDRRPENRFDLTIYTTKSNCIDFDADFDDPTVQRRVDVPNIPGAFVVTNVLSPAECEQIITIAESSPSGFVSDEPLTGPRVESSPPSRRAKNFVWLSRVLSERLFSRCRRHMPQAMGPRKQHLLPPRDGLNARLRLYRYYVGSEYRPHVDGSWPGSGLRGVRRESTHCSDDDDDDDDVDERENKSTEYVYDAFGDRWSRLTAVFYLNDDMCGGHTVFYTPASTEGVIEARGVVPRRGSVLLFPHGGSVGSLVHEGGGVDSRREVHYPN
eukprot:g1395.t1